MKRDWKVELVRHTMFGFLMVLGIILFFVFANYIGPITIGRLAWITFNIFWHALGIICALVMVIHWCVYSGDWHNPCWEDVKISYPSYFIAIVWMITAICEMIFL